MGQTVSAILKSVDDQDEKKKQAEDALNALVTVANDKQIIHYQSVVSNAMDAKLLPIHHVVTKMQRINCGVSKDPSGLKKSIGDAVKNFVKGEIVRLKSLHFLACSHSLLGARRLETLEQILDKKTFLMIEIGRWSGSHC